MSINISKEKSIIGFIGLGAMGSGMAGNLLKAGYQMLVFDKMQEKVDEFVSMGAHAAANVAELVMKSDVVLTSLPSSKIFVQVAETEILPISRAEQVIVDLGTVTAPETRRIGSLCSEKGVFFLDAPVSGGAKGAREGNLYIFIGGNKALADLCRPLFEAMGDPEHVVYCGECGAGQIVKGVNQMAMGLGAAAYLESIAFGVSTGIDPQVILDAVGGKGSWRDYFSIIAKAVIEGKAGGMGIKHGQLPYFMEEAEEKGFELPISQALYKFCEDGEKTIVEANRPSPSFWNELMLRRSV